MQKRGVNSRAERVERVGKAGSFLFLAESVYFDKAKELEGLTGLDSSQKKIGFLHGLHALHGHFFPCLFSDLNWLSLVARIAMISIFGLGFMWAGEELKTLSLPLGKDMERAQLVWVSSAGKAAGILVLCPGMNGNGGGMIQQKAWKDLAEKYHLGLVGLSFSSNSKYYTQNRGYFFADKGSGDLLLQGLHQIYGEDLPLVMFGFSAGAVFVSSFEEWKPEVVTCWCAHAAGVWGSLKESAIQPPGLMACGEDDSSLGETLIHFKQGRAMGKPWLWAMIPKTGHALTPAIEEFARKYFAAVLDSNAGALNISKGRWIDIDQGIMVEPGSLPASLTGWLPDERLFEPWRKLCIR